MRRTRLDVYLCLNNSNALEIVKQLQSPRLLIQNLMPENDFLICADRHQNDSSINSF
jgi:hypothetical protein